ncbi:MAG: hypothetical protein FJ280_09245 [Planctomycetes bacterium]|nr:hypothetical protein [Planctomycetota bacterium]
MRTRGDRHGGRPGTSLVEVTLGLSVILITALGSAYYRYATALGVQIAQAHVTGADVAVTLVEAWQGMSGSESFAPDQEFASYLTVAPATGGSAPSGYTLLGAYDIVVGPRTYRATLCWKDVASGLREIGVAVSWPLGHGEQLKTYPLTAYVRR